MALGRVRVEESDSEDDTEQGPPPTITAATTSSVLPLAGNLISERLVCFRRSSQVAFGYRKGLHSWLTRIAQSVRCAVP
eukprot:960063-Pyramimonas_sp.AAC.1